MRRVLAIVVFATIIGVVVALLSGANWLGTLAAAFVAGALAGAWESRNA